jgi:hypothetical protein
MVAWIVAGEAAFQQLAGPHAWKCRPQPGRGGGYRQLESNYAALLRQSVSGQGRVD